MSVKKDLPGPEVLWQDITPGGAVFTPATSASFQTGNWSPVKPVLERDKCKSCFLCVPVCPDSVIAVNNGNLHFHTEHCKGCGICSEVCAFGALSLQEV